MDIEKQNFHWKMNFNYNVPKKRELYFKLIQKLRERQIVSIVGLRRTGKTTILKQLMDFLIQQNVPRENILYFSFDEEQPKLRQIIDKYETKMGKLVMDTKDKFYIFFDEIQKLENWENQIKYYYDSYEKIKFFVSGSSSLFIKKGSRESLAGRIYEFALQPLSFREFITIRGNDEFAQNEKMFSEALKKEFSLYLKRQFIEIIDKNEESIAEYLSTVLEKIIYYDIPKIFPVEYRDLLLRIMRIVASHPGMLSDYDSLSKELGISRITLSNYFFYLEESFLLKKVYNFSKNMLTTEKKLKRFYLSSTSFFAYLNNNIEESKLVENLVVSQLATKFFWRDSFKNEVDAIIENNNSIIPIEIKYKDTISKRDIKGILRFSELFSCNQGFVLTKDLSKEEDLRLKNGRMIKMIYMPVHIFLLKFLKE